jgi:hypothetical protein
MTLSIRRVVTGHDTQRRAKVLVDEQVKNVISNRPGATSSVIWSSEGFPVNNDGDQDPTGKSIKTTVDNGTVFRVVKFDPAVVISGEIDMELDVGTVHLKQGDVLVQRGTIHNWVNKGKEPCVIAFTLVSAKPVTAGGKTLAAHG